MAPTGRVGLLVLISHSSKDAALASELTEFLRAGLALRADQIRCSSVDGYRLPAGVNTEAQLREEVHSAKEVIGLITPNSLASPYVMFELGARWGAGLPMIPLLAGIGPGEMRGPLAALNALSCSTEAQLHQLLGDVAKGIDMSVQKPESYLRYLNAVKQKADAIGAKSAGHATAQENMVFERSVYWKRTNGGREGPYCPICYDNNNKKIHLIRGPMTGAFHCGICGISIVPSE